MDTLAPYLTHLAIVYCIFAILTLGFALTLGWLGISNLAHAAAASVGAYTSAILTTRFETPVWFGVLLAIVSGMLFALFVSLLVRRVRGDFIVVLSLGLHYVVLSIAQNWDTVTRGTLGIPGIPRPEAFSTLATFLLPALGALLLVFLFLRTLAASPFGSLMALTRDDEVAAAVLGKNTVRVKIVGLLVAGAVAGLAGALAAHYYQFIDPKIFHLPELVFVLSAAILGGLGSLPGALLGVAVLLFIPELLRFLALPEELLGALRQIIFSLALLLILVRRPTGLLGKITL